MRMVDFHGGIYELMINIENGDEVNKAIPCRKEEDIMTIKGHGIIDENVFKPKKVTFNVQVVDKGHNIGCS